jgi:hypothetical protein
MRDAQKLGVLAIETPFRCGLEPGVAMAED